MATRKTRSKPFRAKRKLDRRIIAVVLAVIVACAGTYIGFTGPQRAKEAQAQLDADGAQQSLANTMSQLRAANDGKRTDTSGLSRKVADLDVKIPQRKDKPEMVAPIAAAAAAAGVQVDQMDPVDGNFASAQEFTVQVSGSSQAVLGWLTAVLAQKETYTASAVKLDTPDPNGPATLSFTLAVYFTDAAPLG